MIRDVLTLARLKVENACLLVATGAVLTVALYPFATWVLAGVHGAIQPAGLHVSR